MAHAPVVGFEGVRDELSWRRAHEELVRIAKKRAGLDFEEGRWLLRAFRAGTHVELGFGSFNEYCERLFGYGARLTQDKLRVAEALEGLPETARALEAGSISFSAARELTRVAIPSTEREWLSAARNRTVREVEQLVSGHRPGSRPDDAPSAEAKRHLLSFEVSGETLATFREAMAKIRRDAGESLNENAALLLMSRHALAGARDEGRSSYQVALTVCESCRRGTQQGRGELVDVSREAVEMAECDGQHIGRVEGGAAGAHVGALDRPTRAKQSIPPSKRRQVLRRDGRKCRVPGCRHATFVDVHHLQLRPEAGTEDVDNLVTLCAAHHHGIHEGRLLVEGTPSTGLTFRHADGTAYGASPSPMSADARAKAFRALTQMGFRESQAKHALTRVPIDDAMTLESLLRPTLRELAPAPA